MLQIVPTRQGSSFLVEAATYGYGWKISHWAFGKGGHYPEDPTKAVTLSGKVDLVDLPEKQIGPVEFIDNELTPQYDVDRDTPFLQISLTGLDLQLVSIGEISNIGIYLTHFYDPEDPELAPSRLLYGVGNFPLKLIDELEANLIFS